MLFLSWLNYFEICFMFKIFYRLWWGSFVWEELIKPYMIYCANWAQSSFLLMESFSWITNYFKDLFNRLNDLTYSVVDWFGHSTWLLLTLLSIDWTLDLITLLSLILTLDLITFYSAVTDLDTRLDYSLLFRHMADFLFYWCILQWCLQLFS